MRKSWLIEWPNRRIGRDFRQFIQDLTNWTTPNYPFIPLIRLGGAVYASAELLDLDLSAGANFIQNFNMDISGLNGTLVFTEHEEDQTMDFTFGDTIQINKASIHDLNNDGIVEFFIMMDPDAALQNETDLGFNVGYNFDLLKAEAGIDALVYEKSVSADPVYTAGGTLPIAAIGLLDSTFNLDFTGTNSGMLTA